MLQPIPRPEQYPYWITMLLLLVFVALAWFYAFYPRRWKELFQQFFSAKSADDFFKEDSVTSTRINALLLFLFTISGSLFICQAVMYSIGAPIYQLKFVAFLKVGLFVTMSYVVKIVLAQVVGIILNANRQISEYTFTVLLFNRALGILLFPICLLVAFNDLMRANNLIVVGVIIVSLLFFVRTLRISFLALKQGVSLFYIILYICTFEILPIVVLFRVFENYQQYFI